MNLFTTSNPQSAAINPLLLLASLGFGLFLLLSSPLSAANRTDRSLVIFALDSIPGKTPSKTVKTTATAKPKPAQAQPVAKSQAAIPVKKTTRLDAGTAIELEVLSAPDVRYLQQGQMIDLRVRYDVVVEGRIVLPAGASAKAVVMKVSQGKLLKKNRVELMPRVTQTADGQYVPLASFPHIFEENDRNPVRVGAVLYATVGATTDVETPNN